MSRDIREIIVHCTASPEGREMTVKQIDDIHRTQNKWRCIGYHKVIYLDGSIHDGRSIDEMGAHCNEDGHNRYSIGVVYVGGCAKGRGLCQRWQNTKGYTHAQAEGGIGIPPDETSRAVSSCETLWPSGTGVQPEEEGSLFRLLPLQWLSLFL